MFDLKRFSTHPNNILYNNSIDIIIIVIIVVYNSLEKKWKLNLVLQTKIA